MGEGGIACDVLFFNRDGIMIGNDVSGTHTLRFAALEGARDRMARPAGRRRIKLKKVVHKMFTVPFLPNMKAVTVSFSIMILVCIGSMLACGEAGNGDAKFTRVGHFTRPFVFVSYAENLQ